MDESWEQRARRVLKEIAFVYEMNYVDYHYALCDDESDRMSKAFHEAIELSKDPS